MASASKKATIRNSIAGRDPFYWTCEINKASAIMVVRAGIVPPLLGTKIARAVTQVIANAEAPAATRPIDYLQHEALITAIAGPESTRLHSGRSRQDIYPTYHRAMQRDRLLDLMSALEAARTRLIDLAVLHATTIVPAYTNGVQAQPTTYGHYLLAFATVFARHAARVREAYARLNLCPLGAAALGTSSFPIDRTLLADLLGFDASVENSYDAGQTSPIDMGVELSSVVSVLAVTVGAMMQDLHTQYHQPRPWITLLEGELTGVSSIMPQKRNPYGIQNLRSLASDTLSASQAVLLAAHNVPPGMNDYKRAHAEAALDSARAMLRALVTLLEHLELNVQRAEEEVEADYSTTTELADVLQRNADVPFRIGHHFASELVTFGRANRLRPSELPMAEVRRIYSVVAGGTALPIDEATFRRALSARGMIEAAKGLGGPQPAEVARMLTAAHARLEDDVAWRKQRVAALAAAQARLDEAFDALSSGHN